MALSGDHGIELMTKDFSEYRRYGSAVTTVNGLTPKDLVDLQNEGFVKIYSAPWRWKPMLKKQGIFGGLLMLLRVLKLVVRKMWTRPKVRLTNQAAQNDKDVHAGPAGGSQRFNAEPSDFLGQREREPKSQFIQLSSKKRPMIVAGHYGSPNRPNG